MESLIPASTLFIRRGHLDLGFRFHRLITSSLDIVEQQQTRPRTTHLHVIGGPRIENTGNRGFGQGCSYHTQGLCGGGTWETE